MQKGLLQRVCCGKDVVENKLPKAAIDKLNRVGNDKQRSNFELVYLSVKSHDEDM